MDRTVPHHATGSDPTDILTSAPGVAAITAAAILGRLGDPTRFTSLAGARAFTGLVPILDASGVNGRHGGPTKRGDAVLRQALFMAAGQARRIDPTLAVKYHRLMIDASKHHNSALCHIATTLLTRIIACWRAGQPYQLRDVDGTPITIDQARAIIAERYAIPKDLRAPVEGLHLVRDLDMGMQVRVAGRIDLPVTVMALHRSMVARIELAYVAPEIAADHPGLAAPARVIAMRAQGEVEVAIEQGETRLRE